MPVRGLPARVLWCFGLGCAAALAVLGGLGLQPAGRVAVGVAGLLAACIAVGVTRDMPSSDGRSVVESAVQAAAWTVGGLLTLAGVATLTGGVVAVLVCVAAVGGWLVVRATRSPGRPARLRSVPPLPPNGVEVRRPPAPAEYPRASRRIDGGPVSALTTSALGRDWVRTTAALGGRLSPVERQALVRRREETLDELERRDPGGFARWLAADHALAADPADYVHGRPVQGDPAAGTDAA